MKKLAPLLALLLILTMATPASAFTYCNPGRQALNDVGYTKLIQPSGSPGSTWFYHVEGEVEIGRPHLDGGHVRHGIQIYRNWGGYTAVARFEAYWSTASGNLQVRAYATDRFGNDSPSAVLWNNQVANVNWTSGEQIYMQIHWTIDQRIQYYATPVDGTGTSIFWDTGAIWNAWGGTSVQAYAVTSNRGNQFHGTSGDPTVWDSLRYGTQYGTGSFVASATTSENSDPLLYGQSEPASGLYSVWDRDC